MNFYNHYPTMRPYVGKDFDDTSKPSILLVGESHYLPTGSSQHTTPEIWYSGNASTLSEIESGYINTAQIIKDAREEDFKNPAHSIWRNSFREINQYGPDYPDYKRVADDIAYCNFFLRPALQGESLNVADKDVEIANAAFLLILKRLSPTGIVFLSKHAHDHFHSPQNLVVPVIGTPHPGCHWWNLIAQKYGNKRGRDILGDYIKTTNWKRKLAKAA